MLREFSKEKVEDRDFEIGGELLRWRYPIYNELGDILEEDMKLAQEAVARGEGNADLATLTVTESLDRTIEKIKIFLEPDSAKKWDRIARSGESDLPPWQIGELYQWLHEVVGRRPTRPSPASSSGDGRTDTSSPEESPSPEETPSE